jgi:hypothetical protein
MQIKFNLVLLTIWELSNWQLSARAGRPVVLLNGIQTTHLNEFARTARTDSKASLYLYCIVQWECIREHYMAFNYTQHTQHLLVSSALRCKCTLRPFHCSGNSVQDVHMDLHTMNRQMDIDVNLLAGRVLHHVVLSIHAIKKSETIYCKCSNEIKLLEMK